MCDTIFAVFTVVWIITRLVLYPRIIYSSSVEAPSILPMFPAYYIFNTLLILLLVLHIGWTYLIIQIAVKAIRSGQVSYYGCKINIRSDILFGFLRRYAKCSLNSNSCREDTVTDIIL